jgi:hypothetical protein
METACATGLINRLISQRTVPILRSRPEAESATRFGKIARERDRRAADQPLAKKSHFFIPPFLLFRPPFSNHLTLAETPSARRRRAPGLGDGKRFRRSASKHRAQPLIARSAFFPPLFRPGFRFLRMRASRETDMVRSTSTRKPWQHKRGRPAEPDRHAFRPKRNQKEQRRLLKVDLTLPRLPTVSMFTMSPQRPPR